MFIGTLLLGIIRSVKFPMDNSNIASICQLSTLQQFNIACCFYIYLIKTTLLRYVELVNHSLKEYVSVHLIFVLEITTAVFKIFLKPPCYTI